MKLVGDRVELRSHTLDNVESVHRWKNDPEIAALSAGTFRPESIAQSRARVTRWMTPSDDIVHLAIHVAGSGELIGFLHIAEIEPEHRRCKLGIVIGEKDRWGQGFGTSATALAARYCFDELGLERIGAETYATNPRSSKMLERVGFVREGVLRRAVRIGDQRVDEYQWGLLREDLARRRS